MSDKIIDLRAERDRRRSKPTDGPWMFSLDVRGPVDGGDHAGTITAFDDTDGLSPGNRLRVYAGALEDLARILRDQAHAIEPDEDGLVLCRAAIWESSRVRTWTSDRVQTAEQVDWLCQRFDEAQAAATSQEPRHD